VVVEILGELERCTRVLERSHVPFPEPSHPCESAVDDRLKRRARGRLAKGFLEQRDGTVDALELGKEDESLGAQRARSCLCEEIGDDAPGERPLARGTVSARRSDRSTTTVAVRVRRRQPERVLGELGGDGRGAATCRQRRSVVEDTGDVGARGPCRQREVTCADERVV